MKTRWISARPVGVEGRQAGASPAWPVVVVASGPVRRWIVSQYVLLAVCAFLLLWVFEVSDLDRQLEWLFYDPASVSFPLKHSWFLEVVLHRGAKSAVHVLVAASLFVCWQGWKGRLAWLPPRNALLAALGMLIIPAATAILKHLTHRYCPWDIVEFGGYAPYLRLFDAMPQGMEGGQCFPAGHASVGFLWIVWAVALRPAGIRVARFALLTALLGGAVLGAARMLQGAHFLSHTLWTLWLAWAISVSLALAVRADLQAGRCSKARSVLARVLAS